MMMMMMMIIIIVINYLKQTNIADGTAKDKQLVDVQRSPFARCLI